MAGDANSTPVLTQEQPDSRWRHTWNCVHWGLASPHPGASRFLQEGQVTPGGLGGVDKEHREPLGGLPPITIPTYMWSPKPFLTGISPPPFPGPWTDTQHVLPFPGSGNREAQPGGAVGVAHRPPITVTPPPLLHSGVLTTSVASAPPCANRSFPEGLMGGPRAGPFPHAYLLRIPAGAGPG